MGVAYSNIDKRSIPTRDLKSSEVSTYFFAGFGKRKFRTWQHTNPGNQGSDAKSPKLCCKGTEVASEWGSCSNIGYKGITKVLQPVILAGRDC
eukprot:1145262-Pelagomonas_calceolata.AAC.7